MKLKNGDAEGKALEEKIGKAKKALDSAKKVIENVRKAVKKGKKSGEDAGLKKLVTECEEKVTETLELAPNHLEARKIRAECRATDGQLESAVGDWR